MAIFVALSTYLELGTGPFNMTPFMTDCELSIDVDEQDSTTFNTSGWKTMVPGLKGAQLKINFLNDFAASSVDSTIWGFLGTIQTFLTKPVNTTVGPTNPKYTGSVIVAGYSPITGQVGQINKSSVTWNVTDVVSRATS